MYDKELKARRFDAVTTEIVEAPAFYFAEDYHQQYWRRTRWDIAAWAAPA
jgi:peptide-methionine (S)-S-oxide reductase